MTESEDRAMLCIFLSLSVFANIVMAMLVGDTSTELRIIRAKCVKAKVATMTYDINTGNSKFVFDVGESKDGKENK